MITGDKKDILKDCFGKFGTEPSTAGMISAAAAKAYAVHPTPISDLSMYQLARSAAHLGCEVLMKDDIDCLRAELASHSRANVTLHAELVDCRRANDTLHSVIDTLRAEVEEYRAWLDRVAGKTQAVRAEKAQAQLPCRIHQTDKSGEVKLSADAFTHIIMERIAVAALAETKP